MKYKISKKKVIEAILTEPLSAGSFFNMEDPWRKKDDGKCAVCAVGAVLRATKKNSFNSCDAEDVTDGIYACGDVELAWESGNFLSILSTEFENVCYDTDFDEESIEEKDMQRFHALMVAEGMCPDVLEFEV